MRQSIKELFTQDLSKSDFPVKSLRGKLILGLIFILLMVMYFLHKGYQLMHSYDPEAIGKETFLFFIVPSWIAAQFMILGAGLGINRWYVSKKLHELNIGDHEYLKLITSLSTRREFLKWILSLLMFTIVLLFFIVNDLLFESLFVIFAGVAAWIILLFRFEARLTIELCRMVKEKNIPSTQHIIS